MMSIPFFNLENLFFQTLYTMDPVTCISMYTIVCSSKTKSLWPNALEALKLKYSTRWPGKVHIVTYNDRDGIRSCLTELSKLKPSFCCFLAHHSECGREYVQYVNQLTRAIDPSVPYSDTMWGILTGLVEEDILFALKQEPLTVKRTVGNCPIDLEKFDAGVWYSEFEKGVAFRKDAGMSKPMQEVCKGDTTSLIVEELSTEREEEEKGVDMVITSGHATERDWNIGYAFKSGKFRCHAGQLYGCELSGSKIDVKHTRSPKIFSAAGNCLMGHVSDENCMALGWMHSASVVQMVGYVVPTWFGYGGWGVHKYFINNPGSLTFAEAFFANQQSLLHELHSKYEHHVGTTLEDHERVYQQCFGTDKSVGDSLPRECAGLLYDCDNMAFYGDPAWEARLTIKPKVCHYR